MQREALAKGFLEHPSWKPHAGALRRAVEANLLSFSDNCPVDGLHQVRQKLLSLGHFVPDTLPDARKALKSVGSDWTRYAEGHPGYIRFARRYLGNVISQWSYQKPSA